MLALGALLTGLLVPMAEAAASPAVERLFEQCARNLHRSADEVSVRCRHYLEFAGEAPFHWSQTLSPAATRAWPLAFVASRWQMMSGVLYWLGETKPESVAVFVHPTTVGTLGW